MPSTEHLHTAQGFLAQAAAALQDANREGSAVESIVILSLLKDTVDAQTRVAELIVAQRDDNKTSRQEHPVAHLRKVSDLVREHTIVSVSPEETAENSPESPEAGLLSNLPHDA